MRIQPSIQVTGASAQCKYARVRVESCLLGCRFATELKDRFSNKENGDDQTWKEIYQAANVHYPSLTLSLPDSRERP